MEVQNTKIKFIFVLAFLVIASCHLQKTTRKYYPFSDGANPYRTIVRPNDNAPGKAPPGAVTVDSSEYQEPSCYDILALLGLKPDANVQSNPLWSLPLSMMHNLPFFYGGYNPGQNDPPNIHKPPFPFPHPVSTPTALSTITSTLFTVTEVSCIPPTQFIDQDFATVCHQRQLTKPALHKVLAPSSVAIIEATAQSRDVTRREDSDELLIDSSKRDLEIDQGANQFVSHVDRSLVIGSQVSVAYVFVPTTIKKTITMAVDGGLKCLPPGFVIC